MFQPRVHDLFHAAYLGADHIFQVVESFIESRVRVVYTLVDVADARALLCIQARMTAMKVGSDPRN